jgi:hypothetical protein
MGLETQNITESNSAIERRHFLIRALAKGNISQEQHDKEMPILEKKIQLNLYNRLKKIDTELNSEIGQVKQLAAADGDLKRGIAKIIIKFLEQDFSSDEVKGIMRQGYKIMRGI